MKCTQCESESLIENVRAIDRSQQLGHSDLSLEIYRDPSAIFFKGAMTLKLKPLVCADCGFVMFTLSDYTLKMLKSQIAKNK